MLLQAAVKPRSRTLTLRVASEAAGAESISEKRTSAIAAIEKDIGQYGRRFGATRRHTAENRCCIATTRRF